MARLILEGCTLEQAKVLADWYMGQGEQDASIWFECQDEEMDAPMSCLDPNGNFTKTDKKTETITLYVK